MMADEILNQNEESMTLLVSAQPSVSNMILKYYLKSLF